MGVSVSSLKYILKDLKQKKKTNEKEFDTLQKKHQEGKSKRTQINLTNL
jgi:hypothetical protein